MNGKIWIKKQFIEYNNKKQFDDLISNHPILKQETTAEINNEFNIKRRIGRNIEK